MLGDFDASVFGRLTGLKSSFDSHAAATGGVHGAVSAATLNQLVLRDANARAQVADPPASDNSQLIATTAWVVSEATGGTVTSVGSGVGLTGGPITGAGTLNLADTVVSPATYNFATITVDQQGRITSASNGAAALSSQNMIAGNGISGGGTLAADRTFTFAPDELANMIIGNFSQNDSVIVNDGGTPKQIDRQDMGVPVVNVSAGQTFTFPDANTHQVMTSASPQTWIIPADATTAFNIGTVILMTAREAGSITVDPASTVLLTTVIARGSTISRTVNAGGTACIIKVLTNEWVLYGDIS